VGWWCAVLAIGAAGPPAPRATQTRLMQAAGQRGSGVAGERDVSRVHLTVGNRSGYRGNRSYRSGSVRKKLGKQEAVWNGITDTGTKGCVKRENRESKMQRRCKKWCLEYRNTKSKYWKH
jgi:hypothetical protein